jgi:indolepyruvate decarboxylase
MPQSAEMTVGKYLIRRLEQLGLKHIFGVPGDYVLKFFDLLEASEIKVVCTCNELNAGYAADAYARIRGLGGVCVTYGVGGFSVLNAVAGAFVERAPLVVISGGPRLSLRKASEPHLLHHTLENKQVELEVFRMVTAAAAILVDPADAPRQIDEALAACLREQRPVYLEIPMDMVAQPCGEPGPFVTETTVSSDPAALAEAVAAASEMVRRASNPAVWAGEEVRRLGAQEELRAMLEHTGYPVCTSIQGKGVVPESLPSYVGTYRGPSGSQDARQVVEGADALLSLGVLMTDINLGNTRSPFDPDRTIVAFADEVRIKGASFPQVALKDFIRGLGAALPRDCADPLRTKHPSQVLKESLEVQPGARLTTERFWQRLNRFLEGHHVILGDAGSPMLSAAELYLPDGALFLTQAFYLSLGYTVPAALGAKLAAPDHRPLVFVGDGAFQMTCQEVSTLIRHRLNPIIFLINNDGYQIERVFHDGPYNDLQMWKYHRLPEVFGGGWGCEVKTEGELEVALARAKENSDSLALIEVRLDKLDLSVPLSRMAKTMKQ